MYLEKTEVMGSYGDVFLAYHNSYNWESLRLNTSDSDLEAIACKLQLQNDVLIIIAARPALEGGQSRPWPTQLFCQFLNRYTLIEQSVTLIEQSVTNT